MKRKTILTQNLERKATVNSVHVGSHFKVLVFCIFLCFTPSVLANVVADSVADWTETGTQGENGWTYGYYEPPTKTIRAEIPHPDAVYHPDDFQAFVEGRWGDTVYTHAANEQITVVSGVWGHKSERNPHPPQTFVTKHGGHPQFPSWSNGQSEPEHKLQYAIRRWESDVSGNATITYNHSKIQTECGNGSTVILYHNGTVLGSNTITSYDRTGVDDSVSVSLAEGDFVDLALSGFGSKVKPNGRDIDERQWWLSSCDYSNFGMSIELATAVTSGDYNSDGVVNVADINLQAEAIADTAPDLATYDENSDGVVDIADRKILVGDHLNTWMGDADLSGQFDTTDLVVVFAVGKYETDASAGWEEGDWDGDGSFLTGDLVAAFADGGYEVGPKAAVATVPEPSGIVLAVISLIGLFGISRRRHC
ncbi:MAG: hypothetical protein GY768_16170 [Planctomycetaceae bacterium]|nr:hypothetical protein [Planctomycetaceae bacterium]